MRSSAFSKVFRMDTASSASTWKAPFDRTASTYSQHKMIYILYMYLVEVFIELLEET